MLQSAAKHAKTGQKSRN